MIRTAPAKLVQKVLNENAADQVLDVEKLMNHVSNASNQVGSSLVSILASWGLVFDKASVAILFVSQFALNIFFVSYNFYYSPKPGSDERGLYSVSK